VCHSKSKGRSCVRVQPLVLSVASFGPFFIVIPEGSWGSTKRGKKEEKGKNTSAEIVYCCVMAVVEMIR